MRRGYVDVNGRQLHYRTAGRGAPVVLLHPSPLSSEAVTPMALGLSESFEVFALDTPGYGQSDPLDFPAETLQDYLPTFVAAMDALGIEKTCLYGAATGAQFAIQFALAHPERVALLVLDACGHISDEECARVIDRYFVDTTPRPDGAHLAATWHACRDLSVFFPWCEASRETRLAIDVPPPAVIQDAFVMGYLRAGRDYWRAYRPAFEAERAEHVQRLQVPTVVTRWESSIVLQMTDDLLAHELPANVVTLPLAAGLDARVAGVREHLVRHYQNPARADAGPAAPGFKKTYIELPDGVLHARGDLSGSGRPVIVLHDPAGSSALTEPIARGFAAGRPVVALDLPGNGESDSFGEASPEDYANAVGASMDALGLEEVDVFGRYSGSAVGLELARRLPQRVASLWLSGALQFESQDKAALLEHYTPDISARWDGTHLLTAWHMMRDQALFWPWFARSARTVVDAEPKVDPAAIQVRVTELFKCGNRYRDAYRHFFQYDLKRAVDRVRSPLEFVTPRWDPVAAEAEAAATALGVGHRSLPDALVDWGPALVET